MAKKKGNVYGQVVVYEKTYKGTSIGRRPNTSSMNKNRRRQLGKKPYYRGQGRWTKGQTFTQMERWLILDYHKILAHQKVEVAVEIVVNIATGDHFVIFIKLLVLKMFMFVINGDQDILKGNGTYNS